MADTAPAGGPTGDRDGDGQAGGGGEEHRILTLDTITAKLDDLAAKVEQFVTAGTHAGSSGVKSGAAPAAAPAPGGGGWQSQAAAAEGRRAEIRDELAALKKQEQADAAAQATQDRLGKLEKAAKDAAEKPPRELRRIEQFFGWGE